MWSSTTITSSAWPCHLLGEDSDRCRAAADAHALLALAVDDRRDACLDDDARAVVDLHFDCLLVREPQHRVAGDVALPSSTPPVRWRTPPRESICEPYSAGRHMPICSPSTRTPRAPGRGTVGVDLHLEPQ
jgi:hypothetical protein